MVNSYERYLNPSENCYDIDKDFLKGWSIEENDIIEASDEIEDDKNYLNSDTLYECKGVSTAFVRFDEWSRRFGCKIVDQINVYPSYAASEPEEKAVFNDNVPISDAEEQVKLSCRKMAELFEETNRFLYIDKTLNIYDKKYGLFVPIDKENSDALIRRQSPEEIKDKLTRYSINEIILWIQSKTNWDKVDGEKLKHINSSYLNFRNCTLELPSLKSYEHNPNFYCTNVLNINYSEYYGDYRECLFFRMLNDFFGDDQGRKDLLQEIFAVTIAGIPLKYFFCFYGVPDSGKSKIDDVLRYIIGSEYTSAITLNRLDTQFGLGGLYRKRLNIASESSEVTNDGMEIIKRLTGGDYTLGEKKYEHAFEFYPQATLVFMSNHKLKIVEGKADQAFLNRMTVLVFDRSIPIEGQDTKLSIKLKSEDEVKAIISWALEGVRRIYQNNLKLTQLANPKDYITNNTSAIIKNEREIMLKDFEEYMQKTFNINPKNKEDCVSVSDIFDGFKEYLGGVVDFEYKDKSYLHNILKSKFNLIKKRAMIQKQQVYVYYGLIFK